MISFKNQREGILGKIFNVRLKTTCSEVTRLLGYIIYRLLL